MLNKKKLLDKTLSNKRRDSSGEHLLHEEAFLNGHRTSENSKKIGKGLKRRRDLLLVGVRVVFTG